MRLEPNAVRLKFWRERLAEMGQPPFTLITWRAGSGPEPEAREAAGPPDNEPPLERLGRSIAARAGTLVSIQHAPQPGEIEKLSASVGRKVHDATRANNDLEDVLALLAVADDYICVSSANLHLRACSGKAAKVLVPWPPDWRWMARGGESPWLPGFRLYRQQPNGDWSGALTRLAGDLAAMGCS
jgi:hypothetical protein